MSIFTLSLGETYLSLCPSHVFWMCFCSKLQILRNSACTASMCRDNHVQTCLLLRPVLNIFECFLGVEQAEHKESNDYVDKQGQLRKLQKTAAQKLGFWINLNQINASEDGFFFHQKGNENSCFEGKKNAFVGVVGMTVWESVCMCLCLCFFSLKKAGVATNTNLSPL